MNDLHKALGDIRSIRRQMAHSTEFRGYGPSTLAATAVIGILAAAVQFIWVQDAAAHPARFITLWAITAMVSAGLIAVQTLTRAHRMHSGMADEMIHMAVEQFMPAAAAGACLTFVIAQSAPGALWMLTGLWQVIYSLGIFSSCRFLPRPMLAAGGFYLVSGLACLALGDARALSPLALGIPFGVGQALIAAILFIKAEGSAE